MKILIVVLFCIVGGLMFHAQQTNLKLSHLARVAVEEATLVSRQGNMIDAQQEQLNYIFIRLEIK